MKIQIIIILFNLILFYSNSFGQHHQMSLLNGQQIDERTLQFDVFIKAIPPTSSFTLTAYQVGLSFNSDFSDSGDLSFVYIQSSSNLTNKPDVGVGIFNTDGKPKINIASSAGMDIIQSTNIKIGTFQINNTVPFVPDTFGIKWDFDSVIRTIVLTTEFVDITRIILLCNNFYTV